MSGFLTGRMLLCALLPVSVVFSTTRHSLAWNPPAESISAGGFVLPSSLPAPPFRFDPPSPSGEASQCAALLSPATSNGERTAHGVRANRAAGEGVRGRQDADSDIGSDEDSEAAAWVVIGTAVVLFCWRKLTAGAQR
jgi:hypothetical protein